MSVTEPELGLGLVTALEDKTIVVSFAGSEIDRRYRSQNAPLKRVLFEVGDSLQDNKGETFVVEEFMDNQDLRIYKSGDQIIPESELSSRISFNKPEEKLLQGQGDSDSLFCLRLRTQEVHKKIVSSDWRGFQGGRMALIPHQFYIADRIAHQPRPRVLLADEVGLGKTIEAGLIMHHLVLTGRAERVLVIVPDSLVYQWFLEMRRRFSTGFTFINQEVPLERGSNPFKDSERVIVSMGLLKGAPIARQLLAEAHFDLLVVDEAHQLTWSVEGKSPEYEIVENLTNRIEGVLLLTATPEQLGLEGHFARLRLLDPNRFHDYHAFLEETKQFNQIATLARALDSQKTLSEDDWKLCSEHLREKDVVALKAQESSPELRSQLINHLIDRHGTGRVFFRNTRQALGEEFSFFPKRELHSYPIKNTPKALKESFEKRQGRGELFKLKALWLAEFVAQSPHKIFLICHGKEMVLELEEILKNSIPGIKTGVFHSGLSLMARDRQAAYFAEADGAKILLSTEIGSEGRNFEFVQHLVLFDLPIKPDLLEQRIGRLDRIGQKGVVNIHVPYVEQTYEQILFEWYDQAINSFLHSQSAGTLLYKKFHEQLHSLLEGGKSVDWNALCEEVKVEHQKINIEMEQSRDYLIEMNSFNPEMARSIVNKIKEQDKSDDLSLYMDTVFNQLGVDSEDLDDSSLFVRPGDNMFIPSFPSLPQEGITVTFQRSRALQREEFQFLTWDHPMVYGAIDLIRNSSFGNATLAMRAEQKAGAKSYLESYFLVKVVAPLRLHCDRFLPPTLIRVLIDKDGMDLTAKFTSDFLDQRVVPADKETIAKISALPKDSLKKWLVQAKAIADKQAASLLDEVKQNVLSFYSEEIERLIELSQVNPNISTADIDKIKNEFEEIQQFLNKATVDIDCLRLIV